MQVEAELRELDPAEAEEYLQSLGASEGGLTSLISAAYRQLGLLTYFTTGTFPKHCIRMRLVGEALAGYDRRIGRCVTDPGMNTRLAPPEC